MLINLFFMDYKVELKIEKKKKVKFRRRLSGRLNVEKEEYR